MKRVIFWLLVLTLVTGWASPGWAAGLTLTIRNHRVSLDAQDVTLRQILEEWARVGKTQILNVDRVNSGPMTLQFEDLSENEALDIILRTLPGYWAAPRAVVVPDASIYDRIGLMPTTTVVAGGAQRAGAQPNQDINFTQLRVADPPMNPGYLPEPDDPRDSNDPAIAAAAAARLSQGPTTISGAYMPGPLQPPARNPGAAPAAQPPTSTPANPWNTPIGPSRPGLAPPPPPPTTNGPATRPAGSPRPPQADQ